MTTMCGILIQAPRRAAIVLGLALVLAGCSGGDPPGADGGKSGPSSKPRDSANRAEPDEKPAARPEPIAPEDVRLERIDREGFDAFLRAQQGKVVLVDYWATWCPACLKLFPHTVDLHEKLKDEGLVVVSVSLDDPDDEAQVRKALGQRGASFRNFLTGDPTQAFEDFDIDAGTLPHYQVFDRRGKLHKKLSSASKEIEPAAIDQAVEELLAAGDGAGR